MTAETEHDPLAPQEMLRRSIYCLALELPESVHADVRQKVEAVLSLLAEKDAEIARLRQRVYRIQPTADADGDTWRAWATDLDTTRLALEKDNAALRERVKALETALAEIAKGEGASSSLAAVYGQVRARKEALEEIETTLREQLCASQENAAILETRCKQFKALLRDCYPLLAVHWWGAELVVRIGRAFGLPAVNVKEADRG